jgi:F0F1-type ATP synthase membrane subunit a
MTWWENNINNSKYQHNNTRFNHLPKKRYISEVNSPISLGMEPVSSLFTNVFGGKMRKSIIMTLWEKNTDNSKWQPKNTQLNHLLNSSLLSEVINPISLGMEPVSSF